MKKKFCLSTLLATGLILGTLQLQALSGDCYECEDEKCKETASGEYGSCIQQTSGCIAYNSCELD